MQTKVVSKQLKWCSSSVLYGNTTIAELWNTVQNNTFHTKNISWLPCMWCFIVFLSLSHVLSWGRCILDCIDSRALAPCLLCSRYKPNSALQISLLKAVAVFSMFFCIHFLHKVYYFLYSAFYVLTINKLAQVLCPQCLYAKQMWI